VFFLFFPWFLPFFCAYPVTFKFVHFFVENTRISLDEVRHFSNGLIDRFLEYAYLLILISQVKRDFISYLLLLNSSDCEFEYTLSNPCFRVREEKYEYVLLLLVL